MHRGCLCSKISVITIQFDGECWVGNLVIFTNFTRSQGDWRIARNGGTDRLQLPPGVACGSSPRSSRTYVLEWDRQYVFSTVCPPFFKSKTVRDSLLYQPELATVIATYKRLVVGIAILNSPRETYITYLAVKPGWDNSQIATYGWQLGSKAASNSLCDLGPCYIT